MGRGVPVDFAQAAIWYQKAAERGHVRAQVALAFMCLKGTGLPENVEEALFVDHNTRLLARDLLPEIAAKAS